MALQLWPDPLDGLDPSDPLSGLDHVDAPWNWIEVASYHYGPTNNPRVLAKPSSVTLFQYENALREFFDHFGSVKVLEISLDLHLNEASKLYEDRDFALGRTIWSDETGEQHVFSERWVREGRTW